MEITEEKNTDVRIREEKTSRLLAVKLTEAQFLSLGKDLAREHETLLGQELEKKSVVKNYDARMAVHEAKISEISSLMNNGYEMKSVSCSVVFNYETKNKTTMRLDTQEIIEEVEMNDTELQTELPFETEEESSEPTEEESAEIERLAAEQAKEKEQEEKTNKKTDKKR